jgi:hypothetical protein
LRAIAQHSTRVGRLHRRQVAGIERNQLSVGKDSPIAITDVQAARSDRSSDDP